MNKKYNLLIIALLISSIGWTQGRTDNWLLGYHEKHYEDERFSVVLNMVNGEINSLPDNINFESTMAAISDEEGHLLMYTNGCAIYNAHHEIMQNGEELNPGDVHELACPDYGYLLPDGAMFLPDPGEENAYYLLHLNAINDPTYRVIAHQMMYSKMDISSNNNEGEVLMKNIPLGNYKPESFAVTRHGNGRDWWIVIPERMSNQYHMYLLDMTGIHFIKTQTIGFSYQKDKCNYTGNTVFSPDGTKMARATAHCGMMIMDFDRCSGSLSVPIHLPEVYTDYKHIHCAFSPDSKSIYIIHAGRIELYRFYERQLIRLDLDKLGVARDPYYRQLLPHGVAPERIIQISDGRMVISETNSKAYLHVINEPNEKGDTIYLESHAISFKPLNARSFPYYPNFQLGSLEESPCDTITAVSKIDPDGFIKLIPNPVMDYAYLHFSKSIHWLEVDIINIKGEILNHQLISNPKTPIRIDFSSFPSGYYLVRVKTKQSEYIFHQEKL